MKSNGKLIVIDGLDASGKETQCKLLFERLLNEGYKVIKISFPNYDSDSSALVKMYLNGAFGNEPDDVNAYVASSFFAVDRFASFKTDWGKFYNEGGIILCDRYTTSNMVHQASKIADIKKKDEFLDWLRDYEYFKLGLPEPDGVMFMDMPPKYSIELMQSRLNKIDNSNVKDIHESNEEYLYSSYNNAIYVAGKFSWTLISCVRENNLRAIDDIGLDVYERVVSIL